MGKEQHAESPQYKAAERVRILAWIIERVRTHAQPTLSTLMEGVASEHRGLVEQTLTVLQPYLNSPPPITYDGGRLDHYVAMRPHVPPAFWTCAAPDPRSQLLATCAAIVDRLLAAVSAHKPFSVLGILPSAHDEAVEAFLGAVIGPLGPVWVALSEHCTTSSLTVLTCEWMGDIHEHAKYRLRVKRNTQLAPRPGHATTQSEAKAAPAIQSAVE